MKTSLEGRLGADFAVGFCKHHLALGKGELQSGLGFAALVAVDSVPQLSVQFLNVDRSTCSSP
ncbi:MAG: hypothetical protein R3D70_23785 [Rhizobiaceae bacterium]